MCEFCIYPLGYLPSPLWRVSMISLDIYSLFGLVFLFSTSQVYSGSTGPLRTCESSSSMRGPKGEELLGSCSTRAIQGCTTVVLGASRPVPDNAQQGHGVPGTELGPTTHRACMPVQPHLPFLRSFWIWLLQMFSSKCSLKVKIKSPGCIFP